MVKNYSNLPTCVDVIFTKQLEMRIHSHLLAQTLSPLSFCAKLLFGYIQIFLELGVLIPHFFKLKRIVTNCVTTLRHINNIKY